MEEEHKDAVFGPVRQSIDVAANHANATLGLMDNVLKWTASLLEVLYDGKKQVRIKLEADPVGFSLWLEDKK